METQNTKAIKVPNNPSDKPAVKEPKAGNEERQELADDSEAKNPDSETQKAEKEMIDTSKVVIGAKK